ncbi:MAG: Bacterial rane protein YfhO, partial [Acidobacteria bacterium]|nr:Bacterial rane protein YfhO [Acidobacteriota bacterium]
FPLWSVQQPVWSNRIDDLRAPFLALMNVRFALLAPRAPIPPGWRAYADADGYSIAENLLVLPRAFVPSTVHGARDALEAVSRCADFGRDAWLDADLPSAGVPNGSGLVTTHRDGTRLRLHASMASDAWIVISEPAWKGWQAIERGHHRKLVRADQAFLALHLPRGEHDVLLAYRPRSFGLGWAISNAAAVAIALRLLLKRNS